MAGNYFSERFGTLYGSWMEAVMKRRQARKRALRRMRGCFGAAVLWATNGEVHVLRAGRPAIRLTNLEVAAIRAGQGSSGCPSTMGER